MVQGEVLSAEIRDLQCQKGVLPNSKLKNLGPFLDSYGVLRVGGRLGNSDLSYVAKYPAILPNKHKLTNQIIAYFHLKMFISVLPPFFTVGKCAKLYSENGKTFVGANLEIKGLLKLVKEPDEKLSGFLSAEGIEWKFIPPRAPSCGGLWEAAVKSAKYHLKIIVGRSNLTYEEFLTVSIQIEGILNSRPLCPLSSSADDLNALTPAHFLIGRSMNSIIEPNLTELSEGILKRWQRVARLMPLIWNKWHRGYLSELQQRNKWQFQKKNVKVGDLVVLIEDNMPTFKWPLGRVTKIYSGNDTLIRVVKVQTQNGEYKRAISQVCLLSMLV
ncbi:hypothetical protein AVEN_149075-1 [Araneus ventricosus]|uniref:DUF5641 domain-containing protein n=1 Tax=Araneus ventricosus TaxID=182803 RepID=A0A4Y2BBS3_ARAVE|nr:hypothetical protein AVEN_149075-1 [Araneus ventricosus]